MRGSCQLVMMNMCWDPGVHKVRIVKGAHAAGRSIQLIQIGFGVKGGLPHRPPCQRQAYGLCTEGAGPPPPVHARLHA